MQKIKITTYPNNEIRIDVTSGVSRQKVNADSHQRNNTYKALSLHRKIELEGIGQLPEQDTLAILADSIKSNITRKSDIGQKKGYGELPSKTQFGLNAKRTILRLGGVADKLFGKNALFITLTLPGSTDDALRTMACYSAYSVNRILQFVRRNSQDACYFYVWEHQKRGALHLHLVVMDNDREVLSLLEGNIKQYWCNILDDICILSGVDLWAKNKYYTHKKDKSVLRVDAQFVEKSIGAYLAKYASKAKSKNAKDNKDWYCPTRYWGCSRFIKNKLNEMTNSCILYSDNPIENVFYYLDAINIFLVSSYEYNHKYSNGKTYVAYHKKDINIWEYLNNLLPQQCLVNSKVALHLRELQIKIREYQDNERDEIIWGRFENRRQCALERHTDYLFYLAYTEIEDKWDNASHQEKIDLWHEIENYYEIWHEASKSVRPLNLLNKALEYYARE